jgi:hypothetical protein
MKKMKEFTEDDMERYKSIWEELEKYYDEKSKRLLAAAMVKSLGYGGQKVINKITKLNADTIKLGISQLNGEVELPLNTNRRLGGGRKPLVEVYTGLENEVLKLIQTDTQGDPESLLLWTSKSLANLEKELNNRGYSVSQKTISSILDNNGYSMQANKKRFEGIDKSEQIIEKYPDIENKLLDIVKEEFANNLLSADAIALKDLKYIVKKLNGDGYKVNAPIISELLTKNGVGESNKIDRNSQFEYINRISEKFIKKGNPVISVDGKKKENIGNYKNNGKEYAPKGNPIEVSAYDFIDKEKGKVTPYGIYDIVGNKGWVSVGTDSDTAEFSVASIRQWWYKMGKLSYPNASALLINADSGGSNSAVSKLWKVQIQKLSNEIKIPITVCHFPPGTSKWNKIEHRMFSAISINWRGKPLVSHEVVVNLISFTTNKKGLKISCELDINKYETGIKITDEEMNSLNISFHDINSKYNYTISPFD